MKILDAVLLLTLYRFAQQPHTEAMPAISDRAAFRQLVDRYFDEVYFRLNPRQETASSSLARGSNELHRLVIMLSALPLLIAVVVMCCPVALAQGSIEAADQQILREIRDHNDLMPNLEFLSDQIGPRITGSEHLQQAVDWASDLMHRYGLENVHKEGWTITHGWQRGSAGALIVRPTARRITIASCAWSPATPGLVSGNVRFVRAARVEDLQQYRGKLRGSVVIYQEPLNLTSQAAVLGASPALVQAPAPVPERSSPSPEATFNAARMAFFAQEGVAAVLRDSGKLYDLLTMTSVGGPRYDISPVPVAMTTHEDYLLIWRLLQHGPVEMEIELKNSFTEAPVEVFNTVGEIRGSERPDEAVILCAHLDSWDLASGSTDDGTGVVEVLEAARAIRALDRKPRRTVRIVLFVGEEQGDIGSREYVHAHRDEWSRISAVLEHDTGTPRVLMLDLHQNYAARKAVDSVLAPLRDLRLLEPRMERHYGSDYASFNEVGIPGFSCVGDESDYNQTHHTQADTFDKVHVDGLVQSAQVLAGWAFNTAELEYLVPRERW